MLPHWGCAVGVSQPALPLQPPPQQRLPADPQGGGCLALLLCWYFVEHLLHACQARPPWPSKLRSFLFYEKPRRMGRCQGRRGPAPLSATSLVWAAPPLPCLQGLCTAHSLKPPVLWFLHVAGWTPPLGCHLSPSLYLWLCPRDSQSPSPSDSGLSHLLWPTGC